MARVGESIENPVTGERVTWTDTAGSTGGELLGCDLWLRPGATVALEHRHLLQEERFTVLAGTVAFSVGGVERTAGPGDEVTVPIGVAHRWGNTGDDEARVHVELRPALDTETFFETFFGLARDGKTSAKGVPDLLQIAVAIRELGPSCPQPVKPPAAVQRVVFAVLAPIGRLLGRRAMYERYSSRD